MLLNVLSAMWRLYASFCALVLIGLPLMKNPSYAFDSSRLLNTKSKLEKLENKILSLRKNLSSTLDKQEALYQKLANAEKKIGVSVLELRKTQQLLNNKEHEIKVLQEQAEQLSQKLNQEQQLLAKHIRTRYKMGSYQPLKWLLNQEDPHTVSRLLTYYQYFISARQHAIDEVRETKKLLTLSKEQLHHEMQIQKRLQKNQTTHQQILLKEKLYCQTLIQTLDKTIHNTQETLAEYERNKSSLSNLLHTLAQKLNSFSSKPFVKMQKKLAKPVQTEPRFIQKTNQGITFFAKEGEPVIAVYPGKVVFSDWLRGYGLLLIIDHGQGFMTLYAHSQALFKQKGDSVELGEQIATVGHSGGLKENGLYFEVRHRGKTIPPLEWLS